MISKTEGQSAKDLGKSLKKISGGLTIDTSQISGNTRDNIIASADQASSLIKSIGPQYTTQVKEAVARSITDSSSTFEELQSNIQSMLKDRYKTQKNKALNVAKDQIKKSYSGITASRMQEIGAGTYIWRHSGGSQNPRDYHRDVLNGQTFSLDDPPIIDKKTGERGKPGDAIFCNCYMEPVISFESKG
jgi:SPP1 gp7 family putative phage head morphogenesis protein